MKLDINHLKIKVFAFDRYQVGSWWDFKNHISPFARIFLILDGKQTVSFQGKDHHQKKGSLLLIPPYTPVDYFCDDFCVQYYFIFTCRLPNGKDIFTDCQFPTALQAESWHYDLSQRLLDDLPNLGLASVDANHKNFNPLIFDTQLEDLSLQQKFAAQGVVSLLMSTFAVGAQKSQELIRFSQAFQYIENNLDSELSLEKLSEIENLSKGYFSDQFFEYTGIRPTEYIAQKRETKARELLTTTSLPLAEIATRIGIPDLSYFFRFFKKRVGVTARKYRLDHLPTPL